MEKTAKTRAKEIVSSIKIKYGEKVPDKAEVLNSGFLTEWELRKFFGGLPGLLKACGYADVDGPSSDPSVNIRVRRAEQENIRLKRVLQETEKKSITSEALRELIGSIDASDFERSADWLKGCKVGKGNTGTPFLFLSDIHYDEVVKPSQIGGCNEYNREVADQRIKTTFHKTITLLKKHFVSPTYEGIVCALGGDMLSGNIHEELAETNEASINQSVFALTDLLINGIGELADEFGKVFVPCVVGNHGRLHRKPRAKNRVFDNFEWIIYQYLARYFKSDSRVEFMIPDGADALFNVYSKRICLTHGDQFQGGTGISGLFSPLMLGMARKQRRQSALGAAFDLMMIGHFHQLVMMENLVINGSVKGYDEYAYLCNLPFERPQQALIVMHRDRGMTFRIPISCDG